MTGGSNHTSPRLGAVIDIGTNSVLLLIGRRTASGVDVVVDRSVVTRLGERALFTHTLSSRAMARTLAAVEEYVRIAREHDADVTVVATEAVRLATNRHVFEASAMELVGKPLRVLTGTQEAELSYRSVAVEQQHSGPLRVLDIGGGSTELIVGHGLEVHDARSHSVGSVRLTERFGDHDPPSQESIAHMEQATLEAFAGQPLPPHPELCGVAGTVTTTAALLLGLDHYDRLLVDGARFARGDVLALRTELARETVTQRSRRPCLETGRADVIIAGLTILSVALTHCGARTLWVRDRGLRYALL